MTLLTSNCPRLLSVDHPPAITDSSNQQTDPNQTDSLDSTILPAKTPSPTQMLTQSWETEYSLNPMEGCTTRPLLDNLPVHLLPLYHPNGRNVPRPLRLDVETGRLIAPNSLAIRNTNPQRYKMKKLPLPKLIRTKTTSLSMSLRVFVLWPIILWRIGQTIDPG